MTFKERLRQLASVLPSDDCAVTITRADLVAVPGGQRPSPLGESFPGNHRAARYRALEDFGLQNLKLNRPGFAGDSIT